MAARFEAVRSNDGFDASGGVPWLLVPRTGSKEVYFRGGEGMTLGFREDLFDFTHAQFKRLPGDRIRIEALLPGATTLQAKDASGIVRARLEVDVVDTLEVKTAFHFVGDNNSRWHRTRQDVRGRRSWADVEADVARWLKIMNEIYRPQANILFTQSRSPRSVTVSIDFGRRGRVTETSTATTPETVAITNQGDPSARFNVFFVRRYDSTDTPGNDLAATETAGKNCIIEDHDKREIGDTLAHEAGHAFGAGHSGEPSHLMYATDAYGGRKIPRDAVRVMRRHV